VRAQRRRKQFRRQVARGLLECIEPANPFGRAIRGPVKLERQHQPKTGLRIPTGEQPVERGAEVRQLSGGDLVPRLAG
jgi:hypothetical protein